MIRKAAAILRVGFRCVFRRTPSGAFKAEECEDCCRVSEFVVDSQKDIGTAERKVEKTVAIASLVNMVNFGG